MENKDHIQIRYLRQGTEKTVVLDLSESQRNFMIPARENDPYDSGPFKFRYSVKADLRTVEASTVVCIRHGC